MWGHLTLQMGNFDTQDANVFTSMCESIKGHPRKVVFFIWF